MKMYDYMSISKKLGVFSVAVLNSPQQSWSKMKAGTQGLGPIQLSCLCVATYHGHEIQRVWAPLVSF